MKQGSILALILILVVALSGCELITVLVSIEEYGEALPGPDAVWADEPHGVPLAIYWSPVDGASTYSIYRSTNGREPVHLGEYHNQPYLDYEVEFDNSYTYWVHAVDRDGFEGNSSSPYSVSLGGESGAGVVGGELPAPSDSWWLYVSDTSITVEWAAVSGASEYEIKVREQATGTLAATQRPGTTIAFLDGLQPNTDYEVSIAAVDSSGNAGNERVVYTQTRPDIAPPGSVIPSSEGMNSFELSWSPVAEADGYEVQYSTDSSFYSDTLTAGTSGTGITLDGLDPGTTYYVRVASRIDTAYGPEAGPYGSSFGVQIVADTRLPAPADVFIDELSTDSISLAWTAVAGAVDYTVYWNTTNDFVGAAFGTASTTEGFIGSLPAKTTYYIWVATSDGSQYGDPSTPITAKTLSTISAPDLANAAVTPGAAELDLDWAPIPGASGYAVSVSEAASGPFEIVATPASEAVTVTELAPGVSLEPNTSYWIRVASLDSDGDRGLYSITRELTTAGAADTISVSVNVQSPTDITIEFDGESAVLDKAAAQTMSVTTTLTSATYTWYVDGTVAGTADTVDVDSASLEVGTHRVTLVAKKDGALYSADFTFQVVEN